MLLVSIFCCKYAMFCVLFQCIPKTVYTLCERTPHTISFNMHLFIIINGNEAVIFKGITFLMESSISQISKNKCKLSATLFDIDCLPYIHDVCVLQVPSSRVFRGGEGTTKNLKQGRRLVSGSDLLPVPLRTQGTTLDSSDYTTDEKLLSSNKYFNRDLLTLL